MGKTRLRVVSRCGRSTADEVISGGDLDEPRPGRGSGVWREGGVAGRVGGGGGQGGGEGLRGAGMRIAATGLGGVK